MNRRELFKRAFLATIAAAAAPRIDALIKAFPTTLTAKVVRGGNAYANCSNQVSALKELYADDMMADLVYKENPLLKMVKQEKEWSGNYITVPYRPVPVIYE